MGFQYRFWPVGRLVACRRPYFSLLRQRKVSKRMASQRPWPCGLPCATRAARGRAQTRYAQTSARPDPVAAALLSTACWPTGSVCSFAGAHIARACARAAYAAAVPSPKPQAPSSKLQAPSSKLQAPHFSPPLQLHRSPMQAKKPTPQSLELRPLSNPKKPNWLLKLPFTPAGVKGRGGSGGQTNLPVIW